MIEYLSNWTRSLNPVLQGVLGSALFALALLLGRLLYNQISDLNQSLRRVRQYRDVMKIVIHRRYVGSNGMYYFTQGYLLVIFKALGHLLKGLIYFFIGFALSSVATRIPMFLGVYFCVQEIISGVSWLNDKWADKDTTKYDPEILKEVEGKLTANDPLKGDK
jgi:hypothetical protein